MDGHHLAMTPKNFDVAMAKGKFGEFIVRRILEAKGFIVYEPRTVGAHAFDVLAIKDKKRCIAMDVKAKARRNKYADTGINERHYKIYSDFSRTHNMPFWVVFVDEMVGEIYGNTLEALDIPRTIDGIIYPMIYGGDTGTRYWPLAAMIKLHDLTASEKEELSRLSQRSHEYLIATK